MTETRGAGPAAQGGDSRSAGKAGYVGGAGVMVATAKQPAAGTTRSAP